MIPSAFEPLRPFLGKTWRGVFASSTPEKPVVDISRWELALNSQVVRILHSVNDGEYGGESIIVWDDTAQSLVFYYFTTAGFYTRGTFTLESGKLTSHETVTGNSDGITAVRAFTELMSDGRMAVQSQYLKDGTWLPGRQTYYTEDPNAVVRFKDTP